jgi:hypothetical protein
MKMAVLWVVGPCSFVEVYDVSEVLAASIIKAMAVIMESASIYETSANFYQTTRSNAPENSHLHTRHRQNLKAHKIN